VTKPLEDKRTESVEVCVTPAEKAELIAAAKSVGLQTGTFVRIAAFKLAREQ
jgi:hypothetical protein